MALFPDSKRPEGVITDVVVRVLRRDLFNLLVDAIILDALRHVEDHRVEARLHDLFNAVRGGTEDEL